jgi:hypothetical protein
MGDTAKITAELAGGSQVAAEADKIESRLNRLGSSAARGLGGAAKSVAGSIGGLLQTGLTAAGVLQTLNLANAVEDAKRLDLVTAKLGQSAGVSGSQLKAAFNGAERSTLTSAVAVADFARSLQRTTYDGQFATESIAALGDEAISMGREIGDELPIAAALHNLGVQSGQLTGELGKVRDMAERVGTIGGPTALKDTLAALGPALAGVASGSEEARTKLEAMIAVSTKGLRPEQAKAVGGALLATVRSRAADIQRATGRAVLDDNNNLIADEIPRALQALQAMSKKRFGGNKDAQKRALMADFGADAGLAIFRTDFSQVDEVSKMAHDKGKTAKEAEAFRQSKEGRRIAGQLEKDQGLRGAGEGLLGIQDFLQEKLGVGGALLTELVGGQVAMGAGKAALGAGGKALGAAGLGTAAAVAGVTASFAAPAIAVLSDIGEDRDTMGKRYRSEHAQTLGADLASAAMQRGDLMPVIARAQGDPEVIAAAIEKLALSMDSLPQTLAAQVAAGMQNAKITAKLPIDPNAPKGN